MVEEDMFCLKGNPNQEPDRPSTSRKRNESVPKPTTLKKYPYKMDNMKIMLHKISIDMVDIKIASSDD